MLLGHLRIGGVKTAEVEPTPELLRRIFSSGTPFLLTHFHPAESFLVDEQASSAGQACGRGGTPMKELMLNSLSRLRVYIRSRKRVIIVDLGLPGIVLVYFLVHGCR